ncbi:endo-1,4-beta-xylanase [Roseococcus pinisoli]|uniref:Beta-xylanase n=1 Tax=Roseococcus pinisoli TaxID=2835040 RepID=A0ABS5QBT7_9PROT|nr:endo-1,4-beta-xylanase [Roseococcus pinisoli]MBS7810397.1 endo-1,4-beta-xylanase [Roseococcus pinisoli]
MRRRAVLGVAGTFPLIGSTAAREPGLRDLARPRGLSFGTAVRSEKLASDPALAELVAREADQIVPEWEGKWEALQPERGRFDFGPLREVLDFARAGNQRVRGHALVWHEAMPPWLAPALAEGPTQARQLLETHIATVLGETRGAIRDWDVVNEPISAPPGGDNPSPTDGDLRPTPWLSALGPGYVELALRLARQADPTLRLTLNEFGVYADTPWAQAKRERLLRVVRGLLDRNCPLDAIGVQGHLQMREPFRAEPFVEFVAALRGLGLAVLITEMDVREPDVLASGIEARDAAVAEYAGAFLDAAREGGARTFLVWGLTDRDSWLRVEPGVARGDGEATRGHPYDAELRPKALRARLARFLSA